MAYSYKFGDIYLHLQIDISVFRPRSQYGSCQLLRQLSDTVGASRMASPSVIGLLHSE
jgi:hypothetical protein